MRIFFPLLALAGALTAARAQSPALVGQRAPAFTLTDQFDKSFTLTFPVDKPTFLLFADRSDESARQADAWGRDLVGEYGAAIRTVVIAVPGKGAKLVKNKIKEGFGKSDPILFDWEGTVAAQYGHQPKSCLVVYINPRGTVEATERGEPTDAKYNKFTEKLDE